jgi:putative ABC transport system ATP-binding protein
MTAKQLSRSFASGTGRVDALKQVSIAIPEKRLTVLRGKSGSGKTTLINCLGTLDAPDSGSISYAGALLTEQSSAENERIRRQEFGFVFQGIALLSLMSAYENLDFRLRISGADFQDSGRRIRECLSIVGLGDRMKHRPSELSGGEQQRVAIARAIVHKPRLVFADEPTAELDSKTGLQVIKLFKHLVEEEGITVLMSTHDPNMMDVADRVYELVDGEVADFHER